MKDLPQHPSTMDPDMLREFGMEVLEAIAAEFASDPMSVQCFDLRVVERAKAISGEWRRRQRDFDEGRFFGSIPARRNRK